MAAHRDKENVARLALPVAEESDPTHRPMADGSLDEDKPSGIHRQLSPSTPEQSSDHTGSGRFRKPWELVEEFDHEGHRYRLQRRRIEEQKEAPLAKREEETLELASEGMTRKQIAKQLGLAPSTVGVLLHRASIKLGARSRNELISSYRELAERSRSEQ